MYVLNLFIVPSLLLLTSCSGLQLQEAAEVAEVVGTAVVEAAPALASNPTPLGAVVAGGSVLAALFGHIHAKKKRRS